MDLPAFRSLSVLHQCIVNNLASKICRIFLKCMTSASCSVVAMCVLSQTDRLLICLHKQHACNIVVCPIHCRFSLHVCDYRNTFSTV